MTLPTQFNQLTSDDPANQFSRFNQFRSDDNVQSLQSVHIRSAVFTIFWPSNHVNDIRSGEAVR
jgi:hypothetical protein